MLRYPATAADAAALPLRKGVTPLAEQVDAIAAARAFMQGRISFAEGGLLLLDMRLRAAARTLDFMAANEAVIRAALAGRAGADTGAAA